MANKKATMTDLRLLIREFINLYECLHQWYTFHVLRSILHPQFFKKSKVLRKHSTIYR